MNILEKLRDILLIQGSLEHVSIGDLQTDLDSCVSLFQEDGNRQDFFGTEKLDKHKIRVVVRDKEYKNGLKTLDKIKKTFYKYRDKDILGINLKGLDDFIGKDDKRRNVWTLTFLIFY